MVSYIMWMEDDCMPLVSPTIFSEHSIIRRIVSNTCSIDGWMDGWMGI